MSQIKIFDSGSNAWIPAIVGASGPTGATGIQSLAGPLSANKSTTLVWGGAFWYYSN